MIRLGTQTSVHFGDGTKPAVIPLAQQVARVTVERGVGLRVSEQHEDGATRRLQRPCRRPRVLEDVDADLARLRVHVGVKDGRRKPEVGRRQRIR